MRASAWMIIPLANIALGLATRQFRIGKTFAENFHEQGSLEVTGGCKDTFDGMVGDGSTFYAMYSSGFRCRFYREIDCTDRIGGPEDLVGTGTPQRIDDPKE
jgi:hypothetical protein